jgi:hypothetical protein
MAAAPQEYSVLCRVSGMLNRARFVVPMEVLALMLELIVELFTGFASAATCPQDAAANKKQVISNNKLCLMLVTWV